MIAETPEEKLTALSKFLASDEFDDEIFNGFEMTFIENTAKWTTQHKRLPTVNETKIIEILYEKLWKHEQRSSF